MAGLHERKARAFQRRADVSGDGFLRHGARRAQKAAQTIREMHENRGGPPTGGTVSGSEPVVEWLLTRAQAGHARTVLGCVAARAPYSEAEAHMAVLTLSPCGPPAPAPATSPVRI
ncbi:hypothetical protein TPA0909_31120 [Streptomyces albus]|nr:hypothetical protein TPA0909_31120 [Streptomyces albus]